MMMHLLINKYIDIRYKSDRMVNKRGKRLSFSIGEQVIWRTIRPVARYFSMVDKLEFWQNYEFW